MGILYPYGVGQFHVRRGRLTPCAPHHLIAVAYDSALTTELIQDTSVVGTALSLFTGSGYLLSVISVFLLPVINSAVSWTWLFAFLSPGSLVALAASTRMLFLVRERHAKKMREAEVAAKEKDVNEEDANDHKSMDDQPKEVVVLSATDNGSSVATQSSSHEKHTTNDASAATMATTTAPTSLEDSRSSTTVASASSADSSPSSSSS